MATSRQEAHASSRSNETTPAVRHADDALLPSWMKKERTKVLTFTTSSPRSKTKGPEEEKECVIYWMQRDMRTVDNWAILFARHLAKTCDVPLRVVYSLPPPPDADSQVTDDDDGTLPPLIWNTRMSERHGTFLIGGLEIVQNNLKKYNVPLDVLTPTSRTEVGQTFHHFATQTHSALAIVCDFSPLRHFRNFLEDQTAPLLDRSRIPLYQVDAHNIVPVWHCSPRREVGARTLRSKIDKVLSEFLTNFPKFEGNSHITTGDVKEGEEISWKECEHYLQLDPSVSPIKSIKPGYDAAMARFEEFCNGKDYGLCTFDKDRNNPNIPTCSNMSPWINYGHVSFQTLALYVRSKAPKHKNGIAAYIEEGIVRRELSDNFVYYTPDDYDSLTGAAGWARDTLEAHSDDDREYVYALEEFEQGETHDDLWNAAQFQLVREGSMHGFLRMYWAKKILEWTPTPAIALRTGLYLNDKYNLDGNDPNGFVGVGWSVMGIHDMGWKERPVFGKIRFMNYNGCKRKFKVDEFVAKYKGAKENATKKSHAKLFGGKKRKASV